MEELAYMDVRPLLHISNFRCVSMNIRAQALHPSFSISKISLKETPFSHVIAKMLFNYPYISCVTDNHTYKQPPNMPLQQVCSPGSLSPPLLLHFSLSTPSFPHWAPFLTSNHPRSQTSPLTPTQDLSLLTQQS